MIMVMIMQDIGVNKKNNNLLKYKIPMFILVIGSIAFFIYQIFTKDFDINKDLNLVKIILIFISVFFLGCSAITSNKMSKFFTLSNYVIVLLLVVSILPNIIPKDIKLTSTNIKTESMICKGATNTSDNTIINIDYTKDNINKIVYTYTFDINSKTGAENLVNHFDKKYQEIDNIYSEITISDNVTVTLTYNLDNVDKDKLSNIDDTIPTSVKELKKDTLNSMTCNK